jgi:hypothetical protein
MPRWLKFVLVMFIAAYLYVAWRLAVYFGM